MFGVAYGCGQTWRRVHNAEPCELPPLYLCKSLGIKRRLRGAAATKSSAKIPPTLLILSFINKFLILNWVSAAKIFILNFALQFEFVCLSEEYNFLSAGQKKTRSWEEKTIRWRCRRSPCLSLNFPLGVTKNRVMRAQTPRDVHSSHNLGAAVRFVF